MGILLGALIIGVVAGAGALYQAQQDKKAASRTKTATKQAIVDIITEGEEEQELERRRTERLMALAQAGFASRGFGLTGTPEAFIANIEQEGEDAESLIAIRAGRAALNVSRAGRVRYRAQREAANQAYVQSAFGFASGFTTGLGVELGGGEGILGGIGGGITAGSDA